MRFQVGETYEVNPWGEIYRATYDGDRGFVANVGTDPINAARGLVQLMERDRIPVDMKALKRAIAQATKKTTEYAN